LLLPPPPLLNPRSAGPRSRVQQDPGWLCPQGGPAQVLGVWGPLEGHPRPLWCGTDHQLVHTGEGV